MWTRRSSKGLFWEEKGNGAPVVLLHGLPSPPGDLKRLGEALSGSWRLIVPSLPGYAGVAADKGRHGVTTVEQALVTMLLDEGAPDAALVGHSMGGYRALSLALRSELRPAAVVALSAFAELSADERAGMVGFAAALRAGHNIRPVVGPRFLSQSFRDRSPERIAEVEAWLDLAPPEVLIEELEDVAQSPSLVQRLSSLTCPVLAITGSEDIAVPLHHARQIAAAVPGGRVEEIPGVGHALMNEALEITAVAVSRGLGR